MSIYIWGIILFLAGVIIFNITKRRHIIFVFFSGVGAGIIFAAVWATFVFDQTIENVLP